MENKEKLNLLIDFCGLIKDKKVKKEMLKKIQPFLRGDDLSLTKCDKKTRLESLTAVDWLIGKVVYNGEVDYTSYSVFLNEHVNRLEVFNKAKNIERKNIEAAYECGFHDGAVLHQLSNLPEQYYEDNYNDINYIDEPIN